MTVGVRTTYYDMRACMRYALEYSDKTDAYINESLDWSPIGLANSNPNFGRELRQALVIVWAPWLSVREARAECGITCRKCENHPYTQSVEGVKQVKTWTVRGLWEHMYTVHNGY